MSACVTLSNLGWSTPDGTRLFTDLNLGFGPERTGLVGRNGTGKTTLLRLIAGELRPASGSVLVAGTFGLLRQETEPDPAGTIADLMGATAALDALDRAEAGLAASEELATADWTLPARIDAALLRCGLTAGPRTPLAALSGGQRTRARLAALTLAGPDLLLDEPTNNLDRSGRAAVIALLRGWRGAAIVVSHDRELLEEMDAIVELTTLGAARYGGNYSAYRARKAEELAAARHDLDHAERSRAEIGRRAKQAAERKARKDGAGRRLHLKDDQPRIILDAWKGQAEAAGGANARLREARRAEADAALAAARERIEILQPLRMEIGTTLLPAGKTVLRLDAVIAGALMPTAGGVELNVPHALLDQHMGILDPAQTLRENYRRLNPDADDNQAFAALARFRFRAHDALLRAGTLSGGQKLRAGLACTLGRPNPPQLLILDEPTNHLDLDASEALEAALTAYDGALLVVSHDATFLDGLRLDGRIELA